MVFTIKIAIINNILDIIKYFSYLLIFEKIWI